MLSLPAAPVTKTTPIGQTWINWGKLDQKIGTILSEPQ